MLNKYQFKNAKQPKTIRQQKKLLPEQDLDWYNEYIQPIYDAVIPNYIETNKTNQ
jgi:hypothetical protein